MSTREPSPEHKSPPSASDLRAQLDELLATFDEIAQYGRERRALASAGREQAASALCLGGRSKP